MANTSLLTKIAGTVLVGGGIAGAGTAYALSSNNKVTIKDKLSKENKKLLTGDNQDLWGIKLATYNRIKGTSDKFPISPLSEVGIKEWCSKNIESEASEKNEDLYKRVKEVCIVPTYKEKLLKDNKQLAETPEDWTNRTTAYKRDDNSTPINTKDKKSIGDNELKDWCTNTALNSEFTEDNDNYKLAVKWCTKTGA